MFALLQGHRGAEGERAASLFARRLSNQIACLHADDLLRRNIGGNRNGGNATNRDAELLVIDQQELDNSISRTENWMCSQVLFIGKVQCKDGDTGEIVAEIDYGPISKTVLTKFWSDTTSKPLDDLKAANAWSVALADSPPI